MFGRFMQFVLCAMFVLLAVFVPWWFCNVVVVSILLALVMPLVLLMALLLLCEAMLMALLMQLAAMVMVILISILPMAMVITCFSVATCHLPERRCVSFKHVHTSFAISRAHCTSGSTSARDSCSMISHRECTLRLEVSEFGSHHLCRHCEQKLMASDVNAPGSTHAPRPPHHTAPVLLSMRSRIHNSHSYAGMP